MLVELQKSPLDAIVLAPFALLALKSLTIDRVLRDAVTINEILRAGKPIVFIEASSYVLDTQSGTVSEIVSANNNQGYTLNPIVTLNRVGSLYWDQSNYVFQDSDNKYYLKNR